MNKQFVREKKCNKRHLYNCRYFKTESGCGRGDSCSFSHRSGSRKFSKLFPVGIEEDEGTRKGKLGGGKFDWMPIATKAAPAKAFDLHDCEVQQVSGQELKNEPEMVNSERQRSQTEVMNKDDFYDNLVEAIKEGNIKLEYEMVVRSLEEFEDVEHQRENTKLEDEMMDTRRKGKGNKWGLKK